MNRLSNYYRGLLLFLMVLFSAGSAYAQNCDIQLIGLTQGCSPHTITLSYTNTSGKTVSGVVWDFGDGTKSGQDNPTKIYLNPGKFTVRITITFSDGTTCSATLSKQIHVFDHPKAILSLTGGNTPTTQCYSNGLGVKNKFCFTQSSTVGSDGAPIKDYIWNFGDGDTAHGKAICHSYDSAGTYNVSLTVVDTNGCSSIDYKAYAITVLPDILTNFTIQGKESCGKSTYTFKNNTDTVGAFITKWYWDFGDGSPIDSVDWTPKHTYTKEGKFKAILTIYNKLGCSATFTSIAKNTKPKIEITFKDTICWKNNNVLFTMNPMTDAYAEWDFGDPPSGPLNHDVFTWATSHKYTAPGTYDVKIKVYHNICGEMDTCLKVHIAGPMAAIPMPQLPPPLKNVNNYVPAKPMPKSEFLIINAANKCEPTTLKYSVFQQNGTKSIKTYKYCGATITNIDSATAVHCYNKNEKYAAVVTLKPTDSVTVTVKDSIEIVKTYTKGDPLPTQKVYYPSHGQKLSPQMPDSDLYACYLPNNIVHFTNFTVKYRLYEALDNNPLSYLNWDTPDPDWPKIIFENGWKDTCKNKDYPWASDSLQYLWAFNDPTGVKCTSTVSGIIWPGSPVPNTKPTDCNYSTLPTPYHNFKSPVPPPNGCQTVTLGAWDPVMKCGDTTTLQLKVGPPKASYDQSVFCTMTWEMQQFILPPGQAGNPNKPLRGFIMNSRLKKNCAGNLYHFRLDFSEVIPSCGPENYWLVFDSAAATKVVCEYGGYKYKDYGFLGSTNSKGYPVGAPKAVWENLPWMGDYWYQSGDSGCKTIGVVIQNGDCFDTAWYHDYICFNKLQPAFDVIQRDSLTDIYGKKYAVHNYISSSLGPKPYARICQSSVNGPMGVDVELIPHDRNMIRTTFFGYQITRRPFPDNDWYYYKPFWPDTAEVNPFDGKREDSITSVSDTFVQLADSQVYTILGKSNKIYLNGMYLRPSELDDLNKNDSVNLVINDFRARMLSFQCKSMVTIKAEKTPVCVKDIQKILKLTDPAKDNTKRRSDGAYVHDTVSFHLPYPGFYSVISAATNLDGCVDFSSYNIIYGHFARFNIKGSDSIICVGDTVRMQYFVRYWTTLCPPGPGGTPPPDGCIDGVIDNGLGAYSGILNAWDTSDPIALRKSLLTSGTWKATGGFRPEKVYFNFGDNASFYPVSGIYLSKQETAPYVYKKPGVYTVTMRTVDSIGCTVNTVRKKLIKVIALKPDFAASPMEDTLKFCAPQAVILKDKTKFLGSEVDVPRKFGYREGVLDSQLVTKKADTLYITHIVGCNLKHDRIITPAHQEWQKYIRQDTVYVDSIQKTNWYPGYPDASKKITKLFSDTMFFDYPKNGKYTIKMEVSSANKPKGCADGIQKPDYIEVRGPKPFFYIDGDTAGCAPFTVKIQNVNDTSDKYNWLWGDSNITPTFKGQQVITYTYKTPGTYHITVAQTEPVKNVYTGLVTDCTTNWPDSTDHIVYTVHVYPHEPITLGPDKTICKYDPVNLTVKSDSIQHYKVFNWNFGDGRVQQTTEPTTTITYSKAGTYRVSVKAVTEHGCSEDTFLNLTIDSVLAAFNIDTTYAGIGKFSFINDSKNAAGYDWVIRNSAGGVVQTSQQKDYSYSFTGNGPVAEDVDDVSTYNVCLRAKSPSGCLDSTCKTVSFRRQWKHYNVITPNGDNVNDVFDLKIKGETEYKLQIFNRWGEKVFESESKDNDWNGNNMNTGKACPSGTYFYIWTFKLVGMDEKTETGTVTIIR